MPAQDGVTPLDAANVIHKTSDDRKDNSITFSTYPGSLFQVYDANIQVSNLYRNPSAYYCAIEVLFGNYMIAPYFMRFDRQNGTTLPNVSDIIPYQLALIMPPNSITLTTVSSYNIYSATISNFTDSAMKKRGCQISIIRNSDSYYYISFTGYVVIVT